MRALLPLLSLLILAGCGSSGGGSTPTLDLAITGHVSFKPSVSNRYMPGLSSGKSIWFEGHGTLDGLKMCMSALDQTINGVPGKEIRSAYFNTLGQKTQESRTTYAVTADNKVYAIASLGMPSELATFVQPLMETLNPRDGNAYTDGWHDTIDTVVPYTPYYNPTIVCIGLLGSASSFYYSLDKGFYVEVDFAETSPTADPSTWAWNGDAPGTVFTPPTAPEANG